MKLLAFIVLVWLVCSLIGAALGILGKLIWVAILITIISAIWKYLHRE